MRVCVCAESRVYHEGDRSRHCVCVHREGARSRTVFVCVCVPLSRLSFLLLFFLALSLSLRLSLSLSLSPSLSQTNVCGSSCACVRLCLCVCVCVCKPSIIERNSQRIGGGLKRKNETKQHSALSPSLSLPLAVSSSFLLCLSFFLSLSNQCVRFIVCMCVWVCVRVCVDV
jgi:hypothetical protein